MTKFESKRVESNQVDVHERLVETVLKHRDSRYRKPYQQHNLDAFAALQSRLAQGGFDKLILDSCCGTGLSTRLLAKKNPSALVVGIDQSAHRLNKKDTVWPDNTLMLRANCEDIWRLCVEQKIVFEEHYILYPNPYPKSVHFKRRWHGHAVFPSLVSLSKRIEVRSNWKTYVDEFALAWQVLTSAPVETHLLQIDEPLTLFERKYFGSGQKLYQFIYSEF